ncbi:hypothetical protein [Actinocrispum sp. NPDC049592]|uniref:hypothetical protein n=1 Tax=Actinocrispum sp. NPDC049592 TaxID=3154835 RepID=UPI00341B3810
MTYEEMLAAVRGRVGRFAKYSDPDDLLDPACVRDIEGLWESNTESTPDMWHAAGMLHYARSLVNEHEPERELAESMLDRVRGEFPDIPSQLRQLDEAANRPVALYPHKVAVFTFMGSPLDEINRVIFSARHQIRASGTWRSRMDLVDALRLRFGCTGCLDDLDATLAAAIELMLSTPQPDPNYPEAPSVVGGLYQVRFGLTGTPEDLDESAEAFRKALATSPPAHENHPMHQSNLGRTLIARHIYGTTVPTDLDEGLALLATAVSTTPGDDPGLGTRISALQQAHHARFYRDHNLADLDAAVSLGQDAVQATSRDHPDHIERTLELSAVHLARYQATGTKQDRKTATALAKQIRRATPEGHPFHTLADQLINTAETIRP